jgi:hypothetical protein
VAGVGAPGGEDFFGLGAWCLPGPTLLRWWRCRSHARAAAATTGIVMTSPTMSRCPWFIRTSSLVQAWWRTAMLLTVSPGRTR